MSIIRATASQASTLGIQDSGTPEKMSYGEGVGLYLTTHIIRYYPSTSCEEWTDVKQRESAAAITSRRSQSPRALGTDTDPRDLTDKMDKTMG